MAHQKMDGLSRKKIRPGKAVRRDSVAATAFHPRGPGRDFQANAMTTNGDDDSVQVCKCGLLLSLEQPTFACERCGVTWSLDAETIPQVHPLPQPTHAGSSSIN